MISLIHPSRGRAHKAFNTFQNWIEKSSGEIEIEHILSVDADDSNEFYSVLFMDVEKTKVIINNNSSVVEAANRGAQTSKGEIIVYLSDDFDCPENWDKIITEAIGNKKAMLKVNDLLQPMANSVLTIPILTRELYNELGYFFHPEYKSMWCDVDLYWSTKNYLIERPDIIFPHLHHSKGHCANDEIYKRSELNWKQGLEIYNKRAQQFGWPIKTR